MQRFDSPKINEILSQTPPDKVARVKSSLLSFGFLYINAEKISKLLTVESLLESADRIFNCLEALETPDCPEIYDPDVTPEMINYQKVNRYLFQFFDEKILELWKSLYPDEEEITLAYPVIEWSENILANLPEILFSESGTLQSNTLKTIRESYRQPALTNYLKRGWEIIEYWQRGLTGKEGLINLLWCDMCYPARLSILM
eukprot:TRINITY_DN11724_c0_g1_i1.p1 TRINITY_DN11724_c0_g1~~TRINITY_DN11724_c0_g1_i1.p1  ORF type:complete len:201 (+),score=25.15 TRINITY_DN11724_c0_g1_i1:182-784(+)